MFGPNIDPANIRDQDLDESVREGERMLAWLETAREDLDKIVGTGAGPSGQVKASVDPNGRVLDIAYGPRALRLGSRDLADETLAAVRAASADAERQAHDLMREALPGYDPAAAKAEFERLVNGTWD
ncbi:YbaB/EbfC family nucleoid-associated protein [Nonomuraea basaltis]|uniref:YbaB/EbfC family nucleoid-associated protein n=1 Tax=Nonomuraea basaltis TaxID=2495887 RepID=UPI00110C5400|nr:YbaB/EbfC family nucleoid-associated protein [Nonomuraea basaltis]TMR98701.1 YbaB/EbfC family nucleoid-associated protein [Nonomuraea basaltis]